MFSLDAIPLQTWLDISGSALVVVALIFLIRKDAWYWHFGNASLVPYFALFLLTGQLMLAGLQVSYLIFGLHGLYLWTLEKRRDTEQTPFNEGFWYNLGWALSLAIFAFTVVVSDFSSSWNILQFIATSLALVANWATTRRWIWSWYVWIGVNVLMAILFFHLELWAQFALQGVLAAISVQGLRAWRRQPELQNV